MTISGVHDVGGLPGERIDRSEHARTLYEQRVDALLMLLVHPDRSAFTLDTLRRAIEEYSAEEYNTLSYYDRWMRAIRILLVEQQILTDAEIDARIAEIERETAMDHGHGH